MWPNLQETADFVIFTEEIFHGKLRFLCSVFNVLFTLDQQTQNEVLVKVIDLNPLTSIIATSVFMILTASY